MAFVGPTPLSPLAEYSEVPDGDSDMATAAPSRIDDVVGCVRSATASTSPTSGDAAVQSSARARRGRCVYAALQGRHRGRPGQATVRPAHGRRRARTTPGSASRSAPCCGSSTCSPLVPPAHRLHHRSDDQGPPPGRRHGRQDVRGRQGPTRPRRRPGLATARHGRPTAGARRATRRPDAQPASRGALPRPRAAIGATRSRGSGSPRLQRQRSRASRPPPGRLPSCPRAPTGGPPIAARRRAGRPARRDARPVRRPAGRHPAGRSAASPPRSTPSPRSRPTPAPPGRRPRPAERRPEVRPRPAAGPAWSPAAHVAPTRWPVTHDADYRDAAPSPRSASRSSAGRSAAPRASGPARPAPPTLPRPPTTRSGTRPAAPTSCGSRTAASGSRWDDAVARSGRPLCPGPAQRRGQPVERATERRRRSRWCSNACDRQVVDLGRDRADGGSLSAVAQPAAQDVPAAADAPRGSRPALPVGAHSAGRPPRSPTTRAARRSPHATHASTWGRKPSSASSLEEEAGHDQRGVAGRPGCAGRRAASRRAGGWARALAPAGRRPRASTSARPSRSRSSRIGRKWSIVSAWVTMSSSRALVEQQAHVAGRLEPAAEAALGLAHALGDRPHLAVPAGEEHDDAVGLAQLVGAEDDAAVVVERHAAAGTPSAARLRRRRSGGRGAGTRAPPRRGARAGSRATARR